MKLVAGQKLVSIENAPAHALIQRQVLDMLINQQLPPGSRIVESKLCSQLGVSRTPLREALFKLEQEGFIKNDLARGFSAKPFSAKEVKELYPVIWTLEGLAIKLAASRTNEIIEKLRLINKDLSRATNSVEKTVQLDALFHSTLTEQCHSQYLIDQLFSLRQLILRYEMAYMKEKKRVDKSVKQHKQIIDALEKTDFESAINLIENNWRQGMDLISDWLEWDKARETYNG